MTRTQNSIPSGVRAFLVDINGTIFCKLEASSPLHHTVETEKHGDTLLAHFQKNPCAPSPHSFQVHVYLQKLCPPTVSRDSRCLVVSRQGTSVQDSETSPECLEAGRNELEGFQKLLETFQNFLILSGSFHEFHMNFVHAKTLCFSIHEIHMKFMEASRNFPEFSGRLLKVSGRPP